MKKILLILLIIATAAATAAAQNNQRDIIFLQSGSTVKGQVIDKKADGSVRIKTGDGHIYHFDGKEIQRIEKETQKANNNQQNDNQQQGGAPNRNQREKNSRHGRANNYEHNNPTAHNQAITQQNQYQSRQSERRQTYRNKQKDKKPATYAEQGYRHFVETGFLPGTNCKDSDSQELTIRLTAATTHGYQFDPHKYLGGGIGAQYLINRKQTAITPYIDLRYDFFAELNAPYAGARAGAYIHKKATRPYIDTYVGYHFSRVSLTIGYELAPYTYETSSAKTIYDETKYYSSFLFKIAVDWGGR